MAILLSGSMVNDASIDDLNELFYLDIYTSSPFLSCSFENELF